MYFSNAFCTCLHIIPVLVQGIKIKNVSLHHLLNNTKINVIFNNHEYPSVHKHGVLDYTILLALHSCKVGLDLFPDFIFLFMFYPTFELACSGLLILYTSFVECLREGLYRYQHILSLLRFGNM